MFRPNTKCKHYTVKVYTKYAQYAPVLTSRCQNSRSQRQHITALCEPLRLTHRDP